MTIMSILLGKIVILLSRLFNLGNGSTWPGQIALSLEKNFLKKITKKSKVKIILIAGTNGKTTTAKLLSTILLKNGKKVFQNTSGANLLNGIASSFIANSSVQGNVDFEYAIFEVDENTLPYVLQELTPFAVIILNLFRDQLDRYGEIDSIAKKWKDPLVKLPKESNVFLNADDSLVAFLGKGLQASVHYFGLDIKDKSENILKHGSDSIYCPICGKKLIFDAVFYSHLGIWECKNCGFKRPNVDIADFYIPLVGLYNKYNTLAAALISLKIGITKEQIGKALKSFQPAFGRQEKLSVAGKNIQIFLAKNPTGFNQNLQALKSLGAKNVLIVLNDRIPDGRDISWIWDIDFESYIDSFKSVIISGDRVYDMALRFQYASKIKNVKLKMKNENSNLKIFEALSGAVNFGLETPEQEVLYILPTYSAMLEVRKILTGKKIL